LSVASRLLPFKDLVLQANAFAFDVDFPASGRRVWVLHLPVCCACQAHEHVPLGFMRIAFS